MSLDQEIELSPSFSKLNINNNTIIFFSENQQHQLSYVGFFVVYVIVVFVFLVFIDFLFCCKFQRKKTFSKISTPIFSLLGEI